jgi:hypothetical protein
MHKLTVLVQQLASYCRAGMRCVCVEKQRNKGSNVADLGTAHCQQPSKAEEKDWLQHNALLTSRLQITNVQQHVKSSSTEADNISV